MNWTDLCCSLHSLDSSVLCGAGLYAHQGHSVHQLQQKDELRGAFPRRPHQPPDLRPFLASMPHPNLPRLFATCSAGGFGLVVCAGCLQVGVCSCWPTSSAYKSTCCVCLLLLLLLCCRAVTPSLLLLLLMLLLPALSFCLRVSLCLGCRQG